MVQAFGHEAESLAAFDEVNGQLQDVSLKAIFFSSLTNPATRFVNNIVYAGVGLVGALYAVRGGITIGQLSVFLSYANQYTKPFNEISGVVTELQNALACAARVFELLDAEDQVPEAETPPRCSRTAMCSCRMFLSATCPTARSSRGSRWTCSPASALPS